MRRDQRGFFFFVRQPFTQNFILAACKLTSRDTVAVVWYHCSLFSSCTIGANKNLRNGGILSHHSSVLSRPNQLHNLSSITHARTRYVTAQMFNRIFKLHAQLHESTGTQTITVRPNTQKNSFLSRICEYFRAKCPIRRYFRIFFKCK